MYSIAIVVPELLPVPPVKGGAVEHWVDEASQRMVRGDRKIAIISRPSGVNGHDAIEYIGIPWTPLERWLHSIKEKVTWRNPLRYAAKIQNVYSYATRVAKLVAAFDVVYLHNEPNILLFLKERPGQKIVLHMHNDHLSSRLFRPFYRKALAKADRVLCVSDYIRRRAAAAFPEYANKFIAVLNATNPQIFKPYGDEAFHALQGKVDLDRGLQYLLYAGRLNEVKGVHVLIDAFKKIHATHRNVRLIITGSSFFSEAARSAYEAKLVALAEPIKDVILFTGYLPHQDLRYLYSAVDVVVFPSIWEEPFGLVMLEAMASGTCLIASNVGGIPEVVVDQVDGYLVTPNAPLALAAAICNALDNPGLKSQLEHRAIEKIHRNFSWERLMTELENQLKY